MSNDIHAEHKLSDAVPRPSKDAESGGAPEATPATEAEQRRLEQAGRDAQDAQGDLKDRLVEVGKAHHMGGRAKGRVSDQP